MNMSSQSSTFLIGRGISTFARTIKFYRLRDTFSNSFDSLLNHIERVERRDINRIFKFPDLFDIFMHTTIAANLACCIWNLKIWYVVIFVTCLRIVSTQIYVVY